MSTTKLMTIEEAEARRDTVWDYELVRGEFRPLMPSGWGHSSVGLNIASEIRTHVRKHALGRAFGSDGAFIVARDPDTRLVPDASFVRADRVPPDDTRDSAFPGPPDLAVEVTSPFTNWQDLAEKIEIYLGAGVRIVWVADPRARTITVYRPGRQPVVLPETAELGGEDVLPGFHVPITVLFE